MKNTDPTSFEIEFWGVRGTLATPGLLFRKAGGNTNCIEVRCGKRIIIIDAGTGIRELGGRLISQTGPCRVDLLFTHAHYDHVEGVPFFAPFFNDEAEVNVWCGPLDGSSGTRETVENLMRRPYFPVGPDVFVAKTNYNDIISGDTFDLGDGISVSTCPLNHPGGATGYRIDYEGRSFACITDTEHLPGKPDANILELIAGVDLFAYDASLTDEELPDFVGYGHSTWEEAERLCKSANAGAFMATHHMPFRTDEELDMIEKRMRKTSPTSGAAREGQVIRLK